MATTVETLEKISKTLNRNINQYANHTLTIAGEDWTPHLRDCTVTYTSDMGGSGLQMNVRGSLEDYQDAPVTLELGYGDLLVPYFKGRLYAPVDDPVLDTSSTLGFGPFRNMTGQKIGTQETYVHQTLEYVIMDLARRADHFSGEIKVLNGRKYKVKAGEQFPFDADMNDVLSTLLEKANFVGMDEQAGSRVFMPRPRPGSSVAFKTTYGPSEYVSFVPNPKEELSYYKVVVYRNNDDGKPIVYQERKVENIARFQPRRNRWFVVADFPGTDDEAAEEAYRLALSLRNREKTFTMSTFFNPNLHLYDGFRGIQIKRNVQKYYACTIDSGITVTYAPATALTMEVSGTCYELINERTTIPQGEKNYVVSPSIYKEYKKDITMDDGLYTMDTEGVTF